MRVLLKISLLLMIVLSVSCGGTVRKRVAVEGVESVSRLGWSGVDITLSVRNDLRRDIVLDSCRVAFRTGGGVLAMAELRGGAEIGRLTTAPVRMRFKIISANPSAMQALWRSMAAGGSEAMMFDTEAVVRIGGRERRIYAPTRNLSEILSNFGVSEDDFATWFQ